MGKVKNYINDSFAELQTKVTWPTFNELESNAVVVIAASVIIALLVFGMDAVADLLLKFVYPSAS